MRRVYVPLLLCAVFLSTTILAGEDEPWRYRARRPRPPQYNAVGTYATPEALAGDTGLSLELVGNRQGDVEIRYAITGLPGPELGQLDLYLVTPAGAERRFRVDLDRHGNREGRGTLNLHTFFRERGEYTLRGELTPPDFDEPILTAESPFAGVGWYPEGDYGARDLSIALSSRKEIYAAARGPIARSQFDAAASAILAALRRKQLLQDALVRGPSSENEPAIGDAEVAYIGQEHQAYTEEAPYLCEGDLLDSGFFDLPRVMARLDVAERALSGPMVHDHLLEGERFSPVLARIILDMRRAYFLLINRAEGVILQRYGATFMRALETFDFLAMRERWLNSLGLELLLAGEGLFFADGASQYGDVNGVSSVAFDTLLAMEAGARDYVSTKALMELHRDRLRAATTHLLGMRSPAGDWPAFGPQGAPVSSKEALTLREIYNIPSMPQVLADGERTFSYPSTSEINTQGGQYAMKSSLDPDARVLAVDFGPWKRFEHVVVQRDFGTLSLQAFGQTFLVDAGGFGAEAALPVRHNVLRIDGVAPDVEAYPAWGEPMAAHWHTTSAFDFVEAGVDIRLPRKSIGDEGETVFVPDETVTHRHRRSILFVKSLPGETVSDYWLLLDRVDPHGDNIPRPIEQRLLVAPGLRLHRIDRAIIADSGRGPVLRIIPVDPETRSWVVSPAAEQETPLTYTRENLPVPTAAVSMRGEMVGPSAMPTLLYPAQSMSAQPLTIDHGVNLRTRKPTFVSVGLAADRRDVLLWGDPGREVLATPLESQVAARAALYRLREERVLSISFVDVKSATLTEGDGTKWRMELETPSTFTIERKPDGEMFLHTDRRNPSHIRFTRFEIGTGIRRNRMSLVPGRMVILTRRR